jgi:predicted CXXCH cytochrome family protein
MTSPCIILLFAAVAVIAPAESKEGHDGWLNVQCIDCHIRLPLNDMPAPLREEAEETCLACHRRTHGADAMRTHPVKAVPSMPLPADMPLDGKGRIGCITCHTYHGPAEDEEGNKSYYLRRTQGRTFCYSCHREL